LLACKAGRKSEEIFDRSSTIAVQSVRSRLIDVVLGIMILCNGCIGFPYWHGFAVTQVLMRWCCHIRAPAFLVKEMVGKSELKM
jgi:hypothetical protein